MPIPTIIFEDGQEMVFSGSERITIGRAEDNNVIVDDPDISTHHGEIILHPDGGAEVRDRGSRTGTFVNDQRVQSQLLRHGDHLSFGPLQAVFRVKNPAPSTGTTRIPLRSDSAQREAQSALDLLKTRHAEQETALKQITLEHEEARARLESATVEAGKAQARAQTLNIEADAEQARLDQLHAACSEAEKRLAALTGDEEKARASLKELSDRLSETGARLSALNEEEKQTRTRLDSLKADENAARTRLEQIRADTAMETGCLEEARVEWSRMETRLRESQAEITQSESLAREAADSLAVLQKAITKTEEAIGVLSAQHDAKAAALDELTRTEAAVQARIEAARRELEEIEARLAEKQALEARQQDEAARSIAARLRESQDALDTLEAQRVEKAAELEKIITEAEAARLRLEDLEMRGLEAEERLQQTEAGEQQRRQEAESALSSLESGIRTKTDELDRLQQQLADAQTSLQQAEAGHAGLQALSEEHSRLETALREIRHQTTTAEEQLASTRRALEEEKERLSEVCVQVSEAQPDLVVSMVEKQEGATHTIQPKASRTTITLRLLALLLPLGVLALAWWSSEQSRRMRTLRSEGVVAMLAAEKPALHPYAPRTEAERQIIDLVHEPLMRVGADGALQPALAELWRWSQDVTCWFADEATARQAQERLQAQIGASNRWAEWRLGTVRLVGNSLVLNFTDPTHAGTPQALEVIADLRPLPVAFWRIETAGSLKSAAEKFLATSALAQQARRVWFDRDHAFEIVTVGPAQRLLDELRDFIAAETRSEVGMRLMGEVGALSEPALDLDMRQGQTWHDGTPVTARDVKTTIEQVNRRPWLLPNREALRHIQAMEIENGGNRLRVVFRSRYGPALCGWAGLPVLPASWWQTHEREDDSIFTTAPPPGAGAFRMAHLDARTLSLTPVAATPDSPRFLFHFNATPLMTEIGLGTKTTHLVWPAPATDNRHDLRACLTPPHRRLVVLWNTQSALLADARTRAAFASATDPSAIIAALPGRHTISDESLFPPGMWLHTRAPRTAFSPEKARETLAEAGWLPGVDGIARHSGRKLAFSLLLVTTDPVNAKTAELLAAQWRALGAEITLEAFDSADGLARRLTERRFDAALVEQRFEVSWDQLPWWHSSQARPGGTNFSGIQDPQTDLLLEALAAEFEPAAAGERVRQLEARLLPLHAMLPLFHTVDHAAVSASLVGEQPRASWTLRQLAFKPRSPARTPAALELKLPEE
ncbi:MAG: FHA domain-containing protein [Verrucomicrobiaceae bacterium]|nr:FHA domain-containing protein [Verrucomicrobiaceae bacterium]